MVASGLIAPGDDKQGDRVGHEARIQQRMPWRKERIDQIIAATPIEEPIKATKLFSFTAEVSFQKKMGIGSYVQEYFQNTALSSLDYSGLRN